MRETVKICVKGKVLFGAANQTAVFACSSATCITKPY